MRLLFFPAATNKVDELALLRVLCHGSPAQLKNAISVFSKDMRMNHDILPKQNVPGLKTSEVFLWTSMNMEDMYFVLNNYLHWMAQMYHKFHQDGHHFYVNLAICTTRKVAASQGRFPVPSMNVEDVEARIQEAIEMLPERLTFQRSGVRNYYIVEKFSLFSALMIYWKELNPNNVDVPSWLKIPPLIPPPKPRVPGVFTPPRPTGAERNAMQGPATRAVGDQFSRNLRPLPPVNRSFSLRHSALDPMEDQTALPMSSASRSFTEGMPGSIQVQAPSRASHLPTMSTSRNRTLLPQPNTPPPSLAMSVEINPKFGSEDIADDNEMFSRFSDALKSIFRQLCRRPSNQAATDIQHVSLTVLLCAPDQHQILPDLAMQETKVRIFRCLGSLDLEPVLPIHMIKNVCTVKTNSLLKCLVEYWQHENPDVKTYPPWVVRALQIGQFSLVRLQDG